MDNTNQDSISVLMQGETSEPEAQGDNDISKTPIRTL